MDSVYRMLFEEVHHALAEMREGKHLEAQRTLKGVVLMEELIRHYREHDPHAIRLAVIFNRLEWERTPEGRLQHRREIAEGERVWREILERRI